jgi:hypothetical protein
LTWRCRAAGIVATASAIWCVGMGVWIWNTPFRYSGIEAGQPVATYRAFAEVSTYGSMPLIIPAVVAIAGAIGANARRRWILGVSAFLLTAFVIIGSLSLGGSYLPAAVGLIVATLLGVGRDTERLG